MKEPTRLDVLEVFSDRRIYDAHLQSNPKKHPRSEYLHYDGLHLGVKAVWRIVHGSAGDELKFTTNEAKAALKKLGFDEDDFVPKAKADDAVRESYVSREARFWTRNPKLAIETKERAKYTCEGCAFVPQSKYDEWSRSCLEAHHLDPFAYAEGVTKDVSLSDLVCLCANCHRVIHSMIRADQRSLSLTTLKKNILS